MNKAKSIIAGVSVLSFLALSILMGADGKEETRMVTGVAVDEVGKPIARAWVTIVINPPGIADTSKNVLKEVITDKGGKYRFSDLPRGEGMLYLTNSSTGATTINGEIVAIENRFPIDVTRHACIGEDSVAVVVPDTAGKKQEVNISLELGARVELKPRTPGMGSGLSMKVHGFRPQYWQGKMWWGYLDPERGEDHILFRGMRPVNGKVAFWGNAWVQSSDGTKIANILWPVNDVPAVGGGRTEHIVDAPEFDFTRSSVQGDISMGALTYSSANKDALNAKGYHVGPSDMVFFSPRSSAVVLTLYYPDGYHIRVAPDHEGHYAFPKVPAGQYRFVAEYTYLGTDKGFDDPYYGNIVGNEIDVTVPDDGEVRIDCRFPTEMPADAKGGGNRYSRNVAYEVR